jgi:prepilin-type N-terminal cleavage/methylation domain-containing protein
VWIFKFGSTVGMYMKPAQFIPRFSNRQVRPQAKLNLLERGVTLTELLVSTVVAGIVLSVTLGGAMVNRQMFVEDQTRTTVNQTLRSGMDLIGADIQQAGENLLRTESMFPAVELLRDPPNPPAGSDNWNSVLIVRRLLLTRLPVCLKLGNDAVTPPTAQSNITSIRVFDTTDTTLPADCRNTENRNVVAQWNTQREQFGTLSGTTRRLRIFIYDSDGRGQFINFTGTGTTNLQTANAIDLSLESFNGEMFYNNTNARAAVVEERQYRIQNNTLQLVVDGGAAQTLVNGIERFRVTIPTTDPANAANPPIDNIVLCERSSPNRCFDPASPTAADTWSRIRSVQVTLTATDQSGSDLVRSKQEVASRTLTEQFFPRNILNF